MYKVLIVSGYGDGEAKRLKKLVSETYRAEIVEISTFGLFWSAKLPKTKPTVIFYLWTKHHFFAQRNLKKLVNHYKSYATKIICLGHVSHKVALSAYHAGARAFFTNSYISSKKLKLIAITVLCDEHILK